MTRLMAFLIDAAEPSLMEKWSADGTLPHLQRLRRDGAYGRLDSVAEWLSEATQFAFHTGQNPAATGLFGYSVWQKETMRSRPPMPDWRPFTPFWRRIQGPGPRAIVVDPAHVQQPQPFNGSEIVGWATHDTFVPFSSYPPSLAHKVNRLVGSSLMPDESYGLMSRREFARSIRLLKDINRRFEILCRTLMRDEPWDLFLACNYTLHHAGHRLWNTNNIADQPRHGDEPEPTDALREAYIDLDRTLGNILESVDGDTRVLVFSLHGMGPNQSRTSIFPDMLHRVVDGAPSRPGLLKRLRERLPQSWRHAVKSRLPLAFRRGLTSYWRMSAYRWDRTRAFSLLSDTEAWVRINLKGREAAGIVNPGQEYETLCRQIMEGLQTFVDADTGAPVVQEIIRPAQVFTGKMSTELPDLIVRWHLSPAAMHRAIRSPQFGTIPWPTPYQNPEGRSGNHRGQGVLFAAGPGVRRGRIEAGHILDLAPTLLSLLGEPIPPELEGRPLPLFEREGNRA